MFSKFKKILAYGAAILITLPSMAFATDDYYYTGNWGVLDVEYNPFTENFSIDYTNNEKAQSSDVSSWWLVVTDGPMPNGTGIQLIGDMDEGIITAYSYLGNGANNYQNAEFLGSFDVGNIDSGFELDVSELNAALHDLDPTGSKIEFSEETGAGIWMKGIYEAPEYDSDGTIIDWDVTNGQNNIFDKKDLDVTTTAVSEPSAILALFCAAGLIRLRSRSKKVYS